MLRYTEENVCLFFLSPYVAINSNETRVAFYNRLIETEIVLNIPLEESRKLIDGLLKGIEKNQLAKMINSWKDGINSQEIINTLIRNRVIE